MCISGRAHRAVGEVEAAGHGGARGEEEVVVELAGTLAKGPVKFLNAIFSSSGVGSGLQGSRTSKGSEIQRLAW